MYFENLLDKKRVAQIFKNRITSQYKSINNYAEITGQSYKTLYSWTSGSRLPKLEDAIGNCNILKLPLEYIFLEMQKYEVDYNGDDDTLIAIHESQEFARYRCPNLIYQDVEMIKPLIDIPVLVSLEGRIDADSDSLYVLNLFKRHIKTNSDAWKYCVYILQQKNSPLTMHIEKINATSDDILKWGNEYSQKKEQYLKTLRTTLDVIYLVKNM